MTTDKRDEFGLDAYFTDAQNATPQPSEALLARIMADAEAQAVQAPVPVRPARFTSLWAAIGGWPSAAGLVTATLVGVWIGVYQPAGLDQLADSYLGSGDDSYLVDLMPAFDEILREG